MKGNRFVGASLSIVIAIVAVPVSAAWGRRSSV
jgi:hypothetical protein